MSETAPTTDGHIILVAEEDTAERAHIEANLQRLGYRFVSADPLEHIVRQAAALRPAVILLNSALTAVDALLICQQLRAQSATAEIPILFMIPLAQAAQRQKIFAYPLTDFILQPFIQPELAQRLEAQLPQVAAMSRRSGFGQMLAATGVGLWEWNIRQNEVKWSSLVHSILDIPKETFDGTFESYFALVHDEDKAVIATAIEQTLQDPSGHYQVEHRVILPDGRLRWVEGRALVFKDTNDVPVRMIGTLVDVTERKSAFENVKESRVILERRSKTLSLINEIVNVVYQSLTVPSIATHTLEVIMAHTGVHSAVFYVLDESGETLSLIQSVGLTPEFAQLGRTLSVAHSFTGRAIQARQLLISDKVGHDPDMVKEIQAVLAALEIKRVVSIPLIHDQSVLGAINVSFVDLTEIDEQDTAMLLAVGKTVGLALDNAYVLEKVELEVQERRRSEQALRESEGRYAAVLEQAQDGVLIAQEGIIQFVNRSYAEMVDYPAEALIGRPVADLIAPEYREMVDRHHKARAQGLAAPRMYEAQLICRGGQRLDVEISGGRIEYEGQPASLALIRDITERKKAQEALRLSEAKFSAAFHTSADMVSISDIGDGTFVVVNESASSVVGYKPDELIGKSALELGLWPDPAERLRLVKLLQQAGVFHDEETQLRHKDGHLVAVSLSSSILVIDNTSYVLALIRDISDRKQAEETLRANEAMLRRTQKLAKLGSWSWDLQTNVIKWSNLLREIFNLEQDQEITSAYFQQRIYPADWPEIQSKIREAFRSDVESFFVEHRILRPDNKVGYVWTQTYFNRDENGRVISAYGVTQDITERKRPELVQSILFEISKITTQFDTLEEILVLVREQLGQLLDTTNFYVALYDETNELYHFPFAADEGDSTPWPSEALPNSLTDYVRRTGMPMRIDTTAHENLIQTGAADMIGAISKVWIGTPLKTKRGVVGVMAVQNYVNENAYDEEDSAL